MNLKSKEFLKLQSQWYKKLGKSGFYDIEQDEVYFKESPNVFRNKPEIEWIESKIEYYRAAGKFLYDYNFETDTDRYIWEQHANGVAIRTIVDMLKERGVKSNITKVFKLIRTLAKVMIKNVTSKN